MTLLVISQDLVGLADGLELGFRFFSAFLGDFVGVMLKGSLNGGGNKSALTIVDEGWRCLGEGTSTNLAVCFLDLVLGRILIDSEQLWEMRQT